MAFLLADKDSNDPVKSLIKMGNIFSFHLPRLSWYEHYVAEIHFIRLEENSFNVRLNY